MPHAEFVLIGARQNTDWLAPNTVCSLTNANYDIVHSLAFLELYLTPVDNFEHSELYSSSSLKLWKKQEGDRNGEIVMQPIGPQSCFLSRSLSQCGVYS